MYFNFKPHNSGQIQLSHRGFRFAIWKKLYVMHKNNWKTKPTILNVYILTYLKAFPVSSQIKSLFAKKICSAGTIFLTWPEVNLPVIFCADRAIASSFYWTIAPPPPTIRSQIQNWLSWTNVFDCNLVLPPFASCLNKQVVIKLHHVNIVAVNPKWK